MTTYVALLRGINLGNRNKVTMPDLEAVLVALGHLDVSTYIRSGNVIFTSPVPSVGKLADGIESALADDLGLSVRVLLRSHTDLERIVAANPFIPQGADPTKLHVTFLADDPDPTLVAQLDTTTAAPDEHHIIGPDVYLHCPNGYGRTKLTNAFWERKLTTPATTRNWTTVTTLADLSRRT